MAQKGFKQEKKLTAAQLERRLLNAVMHIDKTKNTREIYFSDKGLRLIDCDEHVLIQTGFHTHVFSKVTANGYSRPALYVSRLIDIALSDGEYISASKEDKTYSYKKLFEILKSREDRTQYNIAMYVDWYLYNVFQPLYQIDENAASQFLVYYNYMNNIACNSVFLEEHKDGLTNKQFIEHRDEIMKEFMKNLEESQIFEPMSDEQLVKQNMEAMQQQEAEQAMQPEA